MEWIEVTGKTLEDAVELALDRLGVIEAELEYEVLDEARTGLFRRSDARIRARVKPLSREKPLDRRRRRGATGEGRGGRGGANRSRGGGGGANRSPRSSDAKTDDAPKGPAPARTSESGSSSGSRRRRGGAGRSRAAGPRETATAEQTEGEMVDATTMPVDEQVDAAVKFTQEFMQAFGVSASVSGEVDDGDIELRIEGQDLGVLVGPKGATLHALEELIRAVLQHTAGGHSARLHLDVAGYRQRRREALAAFATKVADEVQAAGVERALEPMGAADRKVVHDTLSEVEGVQTYSEGEDPRRRVVIAPA
jgi:spoIIIJ-associated protein